MKCQCYVVSAFMLISGVAWGHGHRGSYSPNPYGVYGSPRNTNPTVNPSPINVPQFRNNHYHGRFNNDPYAPNSVSNFHGHHRHPYSSYPARIPHGGGSPYTPYSTPNPYRIYTNPYAPDSINAPYNANIPYSSGNIANPYGIYGNFYNPNPIFNQYFGLINSR